MLEAHYFPLSVALLQRPLQSYILAISMSQKQLRYLHHEQCIHAIPFTRIIRISPYTPNPTTPSSSHHSHHHSSSPSHSSTAHPAGLTDPTPDLVASPSLTLTLHVVGSRIGDTDLIHHHTHTAQSRDGILTLLLTTVTPDNPPLLTSFYGLSLAPLCCGAATKRGKWGGDAARWMALLGGGRLVLFRKEPVGSGGGGEGGGGCEPLTCILLSDVSGIERKGGKKMRLRGSEREWELGLDSEAERDEWWRLLIKEREAIIRRADEWQQEWRDKRAEQDVQREKEQQAEQSRRQLQEDEHKSNTSSPATPFTPHSLKLPDKPKRKTMPSPAFFVNAQVMAARNKRGSLSIKTRTVHATQHGQASLTSVAGHSGGSSSERGEESKTAGLLSLDGSGHVSPWSAVTPRLGAMQLPASVALLRASTAVVGPSMVAMQPSPLLSSTGRVGLGVGGGSQSPPAMSYGGGSTLGLPPSPLMVDEKARNVSGGNGVVGGGVRALDENTNRRSSMTTW